jgi:hypothetical protein
MRISVGITIIVALVVVVGVLLVGSKLLQPDLPLITDAAFSLTTITPNADGDSDVTEFSYTLSRNAQVTLGFERDDGQIYFFRQNEQRTPDSYTVLFSGVVDGYVLPEEQLSGEVLRRLIPNGVYNWRLRAVDTATGETDERTGSLTIADGDSPLPELVSFTVSPNIFTPNQDGIDDHTQISVYLPKAAELIVYLQDESGRQIYVPESQAGREEGTAGRHQFDYDGGVTLGVDPPPDGTYTLYAVAKDAEGQIMQQTAALTVRNGGDPQAEISPQPIGVDVVFMRAPYDDGYFSTDGTQGALMPIPDNPLDLTLNAITLPLGDLLVFKVTVENYGDVPIRTSGPPPGTVYQQNQLAATLGWLDQSGAWRIGLDCDTATRDYPWRWAIGSVDELSTDTDFRGNTYYYLPPGESSVVWGAVRLTRLWEARNPQNCWVGLIHEDVEVRNGNIGAREIELVDTTDPSAAQNG